MNLLFTPSIETPLRGGITLLAQTLEAPNEIREERSQSTQRKMAQTDSEQMKQGKERMD